MKTETGNATGTRTKTATQEAHGQVDIAKLDADGIAVHEVLLEGVCYLYPRSNVSHVRTDRRDHDRDRNYKSSRKDDRRDYEHRDDRRSDRKEERKSERKPEKKDERRGHYTPEQVTSRAKDGRSNEPSRHGEPQRTPEVRSDVQSAVRTESPSREWFLVHQ